MAFDDPGRYIGEAFELAGDEQTVPGIAATIASALDYPVRCSQIPIEEIRRVDQERAASLERLYAQEPPRADIPALREQHAGLLDLPAWLASGGAGQIKAYLKAPEGET